MSSDGMSYIEYANKLGYKEEDNSLNNNLKKFIIDQKNNQIVLDVQETGFKKYCIDKKTKEKSEISLTCCDIELCYKYICYLRNKNNNEYCPYCSPRPNDSFNCFGDFFIMKDHFSNDEWNIYVMHKKNNCGAKINYCPICGRKL